MQRTSTMKLTSPILRDLAQQITTGNPLLGLAIANEYLTPSTPLHKAFSTQVHCRVRNGLNLSPELLDELLQGRRSGDLSPLLRGQLGKRLTFLRKRSMPTPRLVGSRESRSARRPPNRRAGQQAPRSPLTHDCRVICRLSVDAPRAGLKGVRKS